MAAISFGALLAWLATPHFTVALTHSLLFSALYVGSIYFLTALRASSLSNNAAPAVSIHDRDHPQVIKQRTLGALLATMLCLGIAGVQLRAWQVDAVRSMGLGYAQVAGSVVVAMVLCCVIYLGPLMLDYLDAAAQGRGAISWKRLWALVSRDLWSSPQLLRNYVVGPVTEELVFRTCVVSLWAVSPGVSTNKTVFLSPLVFGIAHVHHAWAHRQSSGVWLRTLFQIAYTTVFGWFAASLFIKTGSVAGPVCAHVFCNIMGVPDLGRIGEYMGWRRVAVWAVFLCGLLGFIALYEPMTRKGVFV
ncbi:CAAX prenyl protease [Kickxella alabastrina]|nr:CAAX prenyl protease [Kickxella alabastrina]